MGPCRLGENNRQQLDHCQTPVIVANLALFYVTLSEKFCARNNEPNEATELGSLACLTPSRLSRTSRSGLKFKDVPWHQMASGYPHRTVDTGAAAGRMAVWLRFHTAFLRHSSSALQVLMVVR
jgi:hypothetical protein